MQKCIEKIKNLTKTTSRSKNLLANFCRNFSKNTFNRNYLQKSKKSAKMAIVTKNFIVKKTTLTSKYRENNKNNKLAKFQTCKEER